MVLAEPQKTGRTTKSQQLRGIPLGHWDCTSPWAKRNCSWPSRLYTLDGREGFLSAIETVQSQRPRGIPPGCWDCTVLTTGRKPCNCQLWARRFLPLLAGWPWRLSSPFYSTPLMEGEGVRLSMHHCRSGQLFRRISKKYLIWWIQLISLLPS
jgi:hypothetical protein